MAVITGTGKTQRRKNLGRIQEVYAMPNFVDIQTLPYTWFVQEGLAEAIADISPIDDFAGNLVLELVSHTLGEPKYSAHECRRKDLTYAAPIYLQARLINKNTGEVKEQEVFLGDFPVMTERGTFVINGAERVVVSQLVRSPGVYFGADMHSSGKLLYTANLIPDRGAWLEFDTDANDAVYVRIDRTRKLPVTVLLRALGFGTDAQLTELLHDGSGLGPTLEKDRTDSEESALMEIQGRLRPGELPTLESARGLFDSTFSDGGRYDLAAVGRYKLNKRMQIARRLVDRTLTRAVAHPETGEILAEAGTRLDRRTADRIARANPAGVYIKGKAIDELKVIGNGQPSMDVRVLTPQDVAAVVGCLFNLMDNVGSIDDIDHLGNRRIKTVGELLQNQFRIGLARMARVVRERMSIQDIDNITPRALINNRPVVAAINQFFGSSQLSQFMDQTNPLAELTHKRRLSALGPGGLSRQRAGFEVRDVHHSHYGRMCPIETPEGPSIGLIGSLCSYARINDYGFIETAYRKVVDGRITDEVCYLTADEEDNYAIAQANEPLGEDDCFVNERVTVRYMDRILLVPREQVDWMDVSPKQLVSVTTGLIPFLENDDASRALMGSNMQRQAVPLLVPDAPFVGTGLEERAARDSGVLAIALNSGIVEHVSAEEIIVRRDEGGRDVYRLAKYHRSNQGTCINQRPLVQKHARIEVGEVIADGPATDQGELALGRNLLVAFMPWEGYNYEDAILISERLVKDDVLTSIHIDEYELQALDTKLGAEEITADIPNAGEQALKDLDARGIVRVGAEVSPGDILVGKVTPKGETELTAEERLLRAIFGQKAREVRDTSLRVPNGKGGIVVDVQVFSREAGDELRPGVEQSVRVFLAQKRKVAIGDKMAGRHGNKGVIAMILPEEDMPFLPDGRPVDIILNPLGVPSRMNIGQVLETHLGWAAHRLGIMVASPIFDGAREEDIAALLEEAQLPATGKSIVYDGRTGAAFDHEITVGYIYMMKLTHLIDDKIHARSTGPYSLVTQQPLGGKAQFGGQRFGEMEVWALEAYGAAYTLQEMLTIKSDDVRGRVRAYEAIVKGENIPEPGVPESFRVLLKELQSLGIDVSVFAESEQVDIKEPEEDVSRIAKELGIDVPSTPGLGRASGED